MSVKFKPVLTVANNYPKIEFRRANYLLEFRFLRESVICIAERNNQCE